MVGTPTTTTRTAPPFPSAPPFRCLAGLDGIVLVCFGDCAMLPADTVGRLCGALESGARVAVLGFRHADAAAYGRIIADTDGTVRKMVEYKDASDAERAVDLCNSGVIVAAAADRKSVV